jgi:acetyl esterase/lipase
VAAGTWWTDPPPRELNFGNVRAIGFGSPELSKATIVHFHGGGFRQGCPEMTSHFAAALAKRCGVEVVCPAYRLAPEHPFPAALNDGMSFLRELRRAGRSNIWLSGDSAGGGLAASLTALCIAEQIPVAGLVLLSSWLDLTVTSDCYATTAASDPVFSRAAALEAAEQYLQGSAADNPLASPLFGELAGYPPTFVSVGSGEVLADDARRFCAALSAQGVEAELCAIDTMEHTAVERSLKLIGAADTLHAVASFIDRGPAVRSSVLSRRA